MKLDKIKHSFYFMMATILLSGMAIQVLMVKGDWLLHGDATLLNIVLGVLIGGAIAFIFGLVVEWNQKRTGKGVADWGDVVANLKGIGWGAAITAIGTAVLWVISLF